MGKSAPAFKIPYGRKYSLVIPWLSLEGERTTQVKETTIEN